MIPPGKGVFITGTDTDAGKTIAAAAVLVSMRASGIDAVPMKPVQTGGLGNRDRQPESRRCPRGGRLYRGTAGRAVG